MNKKYLTAGCIVFALLILAGISVIVRGASVKNIKVAVTPTPEMLLKLDGDAVGLTTNYIIHTKGSSSGPALRIQLNKLDGVTDVDCSMFYSHSTADSGRITEGAICGSDLKPSGGSISQEVVFGTCSDVCHFHTDVK